MNIYIPEISLVSDHHKVRIRGIANHYQLLGIRYSVKPKIAKIHNFSVVKAWRNFISPKSPKLVYRLRKDTEMHHTSFNHFYWGWRHKIWHLKNHIGDFCGWILTILCYRAEPVRPEFNDGYFMLDSVYRTCILM